LAMAFVSMGRVTARLDSRVKIVVKKFARTIVVEKEYVEVMVYALVSKTTVVWHVKI